MSRRGRAAVFLGLALASAAAAAAIADGYGASAARGYGPLRPVVVLDAGLATGRRIGPREVGSAMTVRRVPERFAPSGALASPAEALGLVTHATLPAGSYLLAAQLGPARRQGPAGRPLPLGRRPVEIAVSGAGALLAAGVAGRAEVDVIVTSEPTGAGSGRTYVAAAAVPLLALRPGPEGSTGPASATLALTRRQALRLIAAESFARRVTILPEG